VTTDREWAVMTRSLTLTTPRDTPSLAKWGRVSVGAEHIRIATEAVVTGQ